MSQPKTRCSSTLPVHPLRPRFLWVTTRQRQALPSAATGDMFISDWNNDRVLEIPSGSTEPVVLPFFALDGPGGLAVDHAGNLFVPDSGNNRVLELPAGSTTETALPFDGVHRPLAVTVNAAGDLFVADADNNRVVKLPAAARVK